MTDSKYPTSLDSDVEIPRVDDNITEIGGEAINSLRSAVFNIEETLGLNPQGTETDLATRISTALNPDGTIKASALSAIALVTLPIVNGMIATNAGIEESKLDLNYGTSWLKERYDEIYALIMSTMDELAVDIGHLTAHVAHPTTYGRHRTSDIDGYSGATYDGYNLQGIVNDLNVRIVNHLADPIAAHAASAISFDDTNLPIFADNVQDAISETAQYIEGATILHQDRQHSNGILQEQDVTYDETNHSYVLVSSSALYGVSVGSTFVRFVTLPTNFGLITRGDRVDVLIGGVTYTRYIDSTDSSTAVLKFLVPISVSGSASAIVYKKPDEYSAPSSLNIAIRRNDISSVGGSIIQMVHPGAPYVLSSNIMPRNLSSSDKNIKLSWADGYTSDIDVYTMMTTFSSLSSTWTVDNLSILLNKEFADNHYPFISFVYGNELGIAFDEPDGYMVIDSPSADSAWTALGFSTGNIGYALNRRFYIDGYEFTGLKKLIDATGTVSGGSTKTIESISQDILANGLQVPGILRIKGTVSENGTYVYDQINNSTSLNVESDLTPITSLNIVSYADSFGIRSISNQTLYELFLDGSDLNAAQFFGSQRLQYYKEQTVSPQDATMFFNIVDISRNFPASSVRLAYGIVSGVYLVQLGSRGSGGTVTNGGELVVLPTPSSYVTGYRFRAYTISGTDYIEFEVVQDYTTLSTGNSIDIDVYARQSEERYLQVGKVLHNKQYFKYLEDRRLFGNVGRYDVRTDYTRDYVTYPRSLIRGGGVIRDCSITYTLGATFLWYNGGQLLVNGMVVDTPRFSFMVPNDGAATYNLYADSNGLIKLSRDNQFITGKISTPSWVEILESTDKTLLYIIDTNSSSEISAVRDVRRFVSSLDNKVELIIENQGYTEGKTLFCGTFHDIQSAINYIDSLDYSATSVVSHIIKIKGTVYVDSEIELPNGTILMGEGRVGNARIIQTGSSGYISCGFGCTIRDLVFYSEITTLNGFINTSGVTDVLIENCSFTALTYNSNNIGIKFASVANVNVRWCTFNNFAIAILGLINTSINNENYYISENLFSDVRQNALYLIGTKANTKEIYFVNNVINNSLLDATDLVYIEQVDGMYISGNIFTCSATSTAAGSAIKIGGTASSVNIIDNIITNTAVSNQGLQCGILLNGTDGYSNCINLSTISNNKVYNFFGGSSAGISLMNVLYTTINMNEVVCCRTALNIYTCLALRIVNNFFTSGWGVVTAEAPVLKIDGLYTSAEGSFIISNNTFFHWVVTLSLITPSALVEITSDGGYGNIISSNHFIVKSPLANGAHPMLSVGSRSCTIIGNNFVAPYSLSPIWGLTYTVAPLLVSGNSCLVTNNNLGEIFCLVAKNSVTGTASVDYMNKGGTYEIVVPDGQIILEHDKDGTTSWFCNTFVDGIVSATDSTYLLGMNSFYHSFSSDLVPVGAQIVKISVEFDITAGTTAAFDLSWGKHSFGGSTVWVDTGGSPTGLSGPFDMYPDSPPEYMALNTVHFLKGSCASSGSYHIDYLGLKVVYTL